MKKCIYLLLLSMFFVCCSNDNDNEDMKTDDLGSQLTSEEVKIILDKRIPQDNAFAFDLFKKITENKSGNVFISPISVSMALGMALNGADEETKRQMENVLHLNNLSSLEINEYYRFLLSSLPNLDPKTTLNFANSIWYKMNFPIHPDFKQANAYCFDAEVNEVDFAKPETLDAINNWCSDKTNGLIKKPLDRIPSDVVMYLINAIYFKGIWEKEFNKEHTYSTYFRKEDGTYMPVNMMHQSDTLEYAEDEYAQYLNLPYGNNSYSMTLILPTEGVQTDDVIAQLSPETFVEKTNLLKKEEIAIGIPRFKLENNNELSSILAGLGMPDAFDGSKADFSRMRKDNSTGLFISRVIHSTFVEVTEEGTEAAGITIIEMPTSGMQERKAFIANKPFIFLIREKTTGLILFMGKINEINEY